MKVTLEKLNELDACYDAVQWFKKQKTNNIHELFELAKENHLDWTNWYLVRILTKAQKIQYAVFAAKSVLHIYQEKYPNDKRPENAIQAAEKYLKNPTGENERAAADAAYADAYAKKELMIKIIEYGLSLLNSD